MRRGWRQFLAATFGQRTQAIETKRAVHDDFRGFFGTAKPLRPYADEGSAASSRFFLRCITCTATKDRVERCKVKRLN